MKLNELTSRFSYLIQFGIENDIQMARAIFVVCFEYCELFAQIYKSLVNLLLNRIARFMRIFRVFICLAITNRLTTGYTNVE